MKTHRDEINNMSNEELATVINSFKCEICHAEYTGCTFDCENYIKKWLNMEVEENEK